MTEGIKIVGLAVLASVSYGIVHDNVTARICIEYFTVFHPIIVPTDSPTLLALIWGVIATWWMGVGLGIPLAVFARWGRRPKLDAGRLMKPLSVLLLMMAVCSIMSGVLAACLAGQQWISPREPWASRIEPSKHTAFLADLWAHKAAYTVGFVGGVNLWGWAVRARQKLEKAERVCDPPITG